MARRRAGVEVLIESVVAGPDHGPCPECGRPFRGEVVRIKGMGESYRYVHGYVSWDDGLMELDACRPPVGLDTDRCTAAFVVGYPYEAVKRRVKGDRTLRAQMVRAGRTACPLCGYVAVGGDLGVVLCRDEVLGGTVYLHAACRVADPIAPWRYWIIA